MHLVLCDYFHIVPVTVTNYTVMHNYRTPIALNGIGPKLVNIRSICMKISGDIAEEMTNLQI